MIEKKTNTKFTNEGIHDSRQNYGTSQISCYSDPYNNINRLSSPDLQRIQFIENDMNGRLK